VKRIGIGAFFLMGEKMVDKIKWLKEINIL
jgi:hypothetical protein